MFVQKNRLKKKKDFEKIFKQGRSIKESFFLFKIEENNLDHSRIGIVISKKICAKAFERNLIKRRIREIIKKRLDKINNLDVVIVALPGINKNISFNELEKIIDNILNKL